MPILSCEVCAHEFQARAKNAKRCKVCRFANDLAYHAARPLKTCPVTEEKFLGTTNGGEISANIEFRWTVEHRDTEACAFCKRRREFPVPEVRVCKPCSQDPQHRASLLRAIAAKQDQRRRDVIAAKNKATTSAREGVAWSP